MTREEVDPQVVIRRLLERYRFSTGVGDGELSEWIHDAVEPVIRADEREHMHADVKLRARGVYAELLAEARRAALADLHRQVEERIVDAGWHPADDEPLIRRSAVLALFEEAQS